MSTMHEITEQTFEAEVVHAKVPVLVDFTARWCPPCRALAPIVTALGEERKGSLVVGTVDGDAYPALAARLGVKAFPTIIVFAGGKEVARHVGLTTRDKLVRLVERAASERATATAAR